MSCRFVSQPILWELFIVAPELLTTCVVAMDVHALYECVGSVCTILVSRSATGLSFPRRAPRGK